MNIKYSERSTVSAKHSDSLGALYRSVGRIQLLLSDQCPPYTCKALIVRKAKQNKAVSSCTITQHTVTYLPALGYTMSVD